MKKYRIRWDRLVMLLAAVVAVCVTVYYIIIGVITLGSWFLSLFGNFNLSSYLPKRSERKEMPKHVTEQQKAEAMKMTARIDSFMLLPTRLEKEKIAISVYDLTTQQHIYSYQADKLFTPASCMKIPTAVAALKILGINHRMRASLQIRGEILRDTLFGNLLLHADADPMVTSLSSLTAKLRKAGVKHIKGNIYLSLAHSDRLVPHPSAKSWDIPFNKTPLLLKGEGVVRRHLMACLSADGITFKRDHSQRPKGKYRCVANVSHPMIDPMVPMMRNSSNIMAETILFHLDHKKGLMKKNQTDYSVCHAHETFWRKVFSADTTHQFNLFVFNDGSGLSPDNRLTAHALTDMLRYAYADEEIYNYLVNTALASPYCERRGSLLTRLSRPEYRGRIFCKTGTMTTRGISSIAGYLEGGDGHWYIFTIMNDDSPVAEARMYQDRLLKLMMKKQ